MAGVQVCSMWIMVEDAGMGAMERESAGAGDQMGARRHLLPEHALSGGNEGLQVFEVGADGTAVVLA